ncbi:NAD(P)/FAD-dependent oxidoreductase [Microvirga brassicacearum]|uniref:FAD-binding oxidoreductase n=1 Tax=Microvirga brassicacearum TaxID=2580413 RepID=A0A5N3PHL8_9HYPH|nr:FAD-dependent oxidoreductase [Microvirga brassicacearum]KAB0269220.1 FAD-binding oxidoreductase [Microvirga brassicacearum]
MQSDAIVIGAGTVGAAVAYGLARRGLSVLVLDGDDGDYRAARANFGLVWLQGKGMNMPAYQQLTRRSVDLWPEFDAELSALTGIDLQYEHDGGLAFCFGEDGFEQRRLHLQRLHNQLGSEDPDHEMLDRGTLEKLAPKVRFGADVSGASFGRRDGHANPLKLLAALHAGILRHGGVLRSHSAVDKIVPGTQGFTIEIQGGDRFSATRLVIAAGLGSATLAEQVGLHVPLRPQRGQVLVTERVDPLLPLPASGLRQTREGTLMIGATQEETGFNTTTTSEAAAHLGHKTVRLVPALAELTLVRHWAGLRVMTPDSYPVYVQSPTYPGAFVTLCHSGVTLASTHATVIPDAIIAGRLPSILDPFHHRRFDVPKAA